MSEHVCADGSVFSREDVEHGAKVPRGHGVPSDGWQNSRCLSPAQLLSCAEGSTTAEGDLCLELFGCCMGTRLHPPHRYEPQL